MKPRHRSCMSGSATNKHNSKRKAQINKSWNTIKRILPVIIYRLVPLLAQSDCKKTTKPGFEAATYIMFV